MGVVGVVPVMLMVLALGETLQELQLGETSMTVSAATTFLAMSGLDCHSLFRAISSTIVPVLVLFFDGTRGLWWMG